MTIQLIHTAGRGFAKSLYLRSEQLCYNTDMFASCLRRALLILCLLAGILPAHTAAAQGEMPIYTVQPGDTLSGLAMLFHTPVTRLITANNLNDPNSLEPGRQLFIPSLKGYSGEVKLLTLEPGDTLHTLSRRLGITGPDLQKINFLTHPEALPVGSQVIVVNAATRDVRRLPVTGGMTDLEMAAGLGINPWMASEANALKGPWDLVENDTIFLPASAGASKGDLLPGVSGLQFSMLPLKQGKTVELNARIANGVTLSGMFNGQKLAFFADDQNQATSYSGVARLSQPGIYPMVLTATMEDGKTFSLLQNVMVEEIISYGVDYPFQVADELVEPAVTVPEMDAVNQVVAPVTPEKYWQGAFKSPSPTPDCISSTFGRLRSYNGSDFIYFHSGTDFCGGEQTRIFAAADGVVVFTGALTVRGNATIIDHGRGVYTGYWHQSKILVNVGDHVTAGQTIGMVGATGRVTGPHLHFEVFAGGVQVDPAEWLAGKYP